MASAWIKSLQCKSNAVEDVVLYNPEPKNSNINKKSGSGGGLIPVSCSYTSQSLRDVVFLFPKQHPPPPPPPAFSNKYSKLPEQQKHHRTKSSKTKTKSSKAKANVIRSILSSPISMEPTTSFPTLTELPSGHSSRKVVEIIFGSSWSDKGARFPGRIEMLFRVHNPHRTVARFEEYRSSVRARANDARCAVDGNEMMRFHCSAANGSSNADGGEIYDASVACCAVQSPGGKADQGIRTFAGSGGAHDSAGGAVPAGRRSMLVCRVIAGRVRNESDPDSTGESVYGGKKGELIVFDSRAVLPCFLIIYKL